MTDPTVTNPEDTLTPEAETVVLQIPLEQITADPGQPRKIFDRAGLRDLGASIQANGLLQPITVRQVGPGTYMIIAGERRFRASQAIGAATIRAIVTAGITIGDIRVKQIIENDQRVDVTPLEQARSYQALMDEMGWTIEELGQQIGKAAYRITERTVLLRLQPDYQGLLDSGNLSPTEAYELATLSPRGQKALFKAIRSGACRTAADLRVAATAIADAESQMDLIGDEPAGPTPQDRDNARTFERQLERIVSLINCGIRDNQVVAVRKIDPNRAEHVADMLALMQKDLRRIEVAFRGAAIQASFLGK
ncbi:ParB/RepB/Spo0J family partition protein [Rhodopila sp.]|uniref:ParB/RepB/Spo0J family partition protein n=1 Tax=Rhodopila sp. TaxID=2480087 RepID=UPI003D134422